MSKKSATNYTVADMYGKTFGWNKHQIYRAYRSLERLDEEEEQESHELKQRPKERIPLYKWIVLGVFIALFLIGVWLTANNFFLY